VEAEKTWTGQGYLAAYNFPGPNSLQRRTDRASGFENLD
jgi:hypothetical protein